MKLQDFPTKDLEDRGWKCTLVDRGRVKKTPYHLYQFDAVKEKYLSGVNITTRSDDNSKLIIDSAMATVKAKCDLFDGVK